MNIVHKRLAAALALLILVYIAAPYVRPNRYEMAVFGNVTQALLIAAISAFCAINAWRSRRNIRSFWSLMTVGAVLWLCGQLGWVYYEVVKNTDLPDPSSIDVFFFLHVVPFLAASAMVPHKRAGGQDARTHLGYFDFALLLVWWVYLYAFVVGPWQYVQHDTVTFGKTFNALYLVENLSTLAAFIYLWFASSGRWKRIYGLIAISSAIYSSSSLLINEAINSGRYFSGSIHDVPLITCMVLMLYASAGAFLRPLESETIEPPRTAWQSHWHGRLAMVAVFSMPLMALWSFFRHDQDGPISDFRILVTLMAMLLMMSLLFLKQNFLHRELVQSLRESRESYENLQLLQEQLIQTEKLVALGKLVSGAAHEINNPLTAILGYADLLTSNEQVPAEGRTMAEKIKQQARRTKHLVSSLLAFAKQSPMQRAPLDLNSVVTNALQLRELDLEQKKINRVIELGEDLPRVLGDKNHLLQVIFNILANAVDAMNEGSGTLTLRTSQEGEMVVFRCLDTGRGITDVKHVFDPFYTTKPVGQGTGLGLSAAYGIVRDHQGEIIAHNRPQGGAEFVIKLPVAKDAAQSDEEESSNALSQIL